MSNSIIESATNVRSRWDEFWFSPKDSNQIAAIRGLLCLVTALYFASSFTDAAFWLDSGRPFSREQLSLFLNAADLNSEARWVLSPLFLIESILGSHWWIHYLYLLLGISLCIAVSLGRGGRLATWGLWIVLVGWANRLMFLSGVTETLLSLALFAAAIAPPARATRWFATSMPKADPPANTETEHWANGFALRLMAVQITLFGLVTVAAMLASRVWWNGLGAYALLAPVQDRTIDWTTWLANSTLHELTTHLLVAAIPLGLALAWSRVATKFGIALVITWCTFVALLGSHWLYAATFATMCLSLRNQPS
ncbi:MAG: hypothetical protein HKN47_06185 [Pirellulaceae bacterium]|nr:hypothetical protein [Pirellulaceae bacterium]